MRRPRIYRLKTSYDLDPHEPTPLAADERAARPRARLDAVRDPSDTPEPASRPRFTAADAHGLVFDFRERRRG